MYNDFTISPTTYQLIVDLYTEASQGVEDVYEHYYDAAVLVLEEDEFAVELDLLKPFYQSYLSSLGLINPSFQIPAIEALQKHVISTI